MKLTVGSVVYKQAIPYMEDFLESLKQQDSDNFDIILLSDDIELTYLQHRLKEYNSYWGERLILVKGRDGCVPYELRIHLLDYVKQKGYDLLVLCDVDDFFSKNRVSCIANTYSEEIAFYYNELLYTSGERCMPCMPEKISDFRDIAEQNFLGLSNSAFNMNKISLEFINSLYQGKTQIFDWYLFSRLLLCGYKGQKVHDAFTYYRMHDNNLAGISKDSEEEIQKEIRVKLEHYRLLQEYNLYYKELFEMYNKMRGKHLEVMSRPEGHYWWGALQLERRKENV